MLTAAQLAALRRSKPENRSRLAKAIELSGLTQVQIAEAVGSNQPRISSICAGRFGDSGLPIETVRPLADFFGCSIEDLFPPVKAEVA
jgi:transcriptional regulator with XRE-family HTH domain